jgi:hypothetical protein
LGADDMYYQKNVYFVSQKVVAEGYQAHKQVAAHKLTLANSPWRFSHPALCCPVHNVIFMC